MAYWVLTYNKRTIYIKIEWLIAIERRICSRPFSAILRHRAKANLIVWTDFPYLYLRNDFYVDQIKLWQDRKGCNWFLHTQAVEQSVLMLPVLPRKFWLWDYKSESDCFIKPMHFYIVDDVGWLNGSTGKE